jgi:hypothetical protein
MNFNQNLNTEYKLQRNLVDELIGLYGIETKFLIVEKINSDDLVFGDFSHIKSDSEKIYDLMALPENSETYDNQDGNFNQFGFLTAETINLFASRNAMDDIFGDTDEALNTIIGNLIILPNSRILEITHVEYEVPGINNLYTSSAQKNAYKFYCNNIRRHRISTCG